MNLSFLRKNMFFLTGKLDLPFTVLFFPDPPPGEDRMVTTNAPRTAHASRVSQHSTCTWVCTQPPALTLLSSAARQPLITRSFSSFSKHCVTPSHLSRYHAGHDRPLPILVPWQLHTHTGTWHPDQKWISFKSSRKQSLAQDTTHLPASPHLKSGRGQL